MVVNYHTNRPTSKLFLHYYNEAVAAGDVDGERALQFIKPGETRWTGLYLMGQRVHDQRAYLLLFEDGHPGVDGCCLTSQEHQLLGQVLAVMERFKSAMDVFQTTDSVVISQVYPILLSIYGEPTKNGAVLVIPGAKEDITASELLPPLKELRKGLIISLLHTRCFGMNKGEFAKNFTIYGSAAYLDPQNIAVQLLFRFKLETGSSVMDYLHQAVNYLVRQGMEDIITFLEREAARNPSAPRTTRAFNHYGKESATVAPHHQHAKEKQHEDGEDKENDQKDDGGDGGSPPAKRAKNWWEPFQAQLLSDCGTLEGGGGGLAGVAWPNKCITERVATLLFK